MLGIVEKGLECFNCHCRIKESILNFFIRYILVLLLLNKCQHMLRMFLKEYNVYTFNKTDNIVGFKIHL